MNKFVLKLIGIAALAGAVHVAHADWQYTTWGMSPVEVIAAGKNAGAELLSVKPGRTEDDTKPYMVDGTFTNGAFSFDAAFFFSKDKTSPKLQSVSLTLRKGECSQVVNALEGNYGKPEVVTSEYEKMSKAFSVLWKDQPSNMRIRLSTLFVCNISYMQLAPVGAGKGL